MLRRLFFVSSNDNGYLSLTPKQLRMIWGVVVVTCLTVAFVVFRFIFATVNEIHRPSDTCLLRMTQAKSHCAFSGLVHGDNAATDLKSFCFYGVLSVSDDGYSVDSDTHVTLVEYGSFSVDVAATATAQEEWDDICREKVTKYRFDEVVLHGVHNTNTKQHTQRLHLTPKTSWCFQQQYQKQFVRPSEGGSDEKRCHLSSRFGSLSLGKDEL